MADAKSTLDCGTNYLYPTGFRVVIDRDYFPNLQFYAQTVDHPAFSLANTEVPYRRAGIKLVGESLEFSPLQMNIIVDENMKSYEEIRQWAEQVIENEHKPPATNIYKSQEEIKPPYYDITLGILTSNNNLNKKFIYRNAYPIDVGSISLSSTDGSIPLTFSVTFNYDYFDFE